MSTKSAGSTRSAIASGKPTATTKKRPKKLVAPDPAKAASTVPGSATIVSDTPVATSEPTLRKRELINTVVERSGVRKKFAKPVVEAMIAVLGDALKEGRDMNLQPLGRIKQQRVKDVANARITIAKIRQNKAADPSAEDSKTEVATTAE